MLWVKIGTHITDHPRFLQLGTAARDLWVWGMLYSGSHDLDGELPMAAVMTSAWGRGDRGNVKLALTLVEAGLWERTATGWKILRWSEQGNQTKAQILAGREATKVRVARFRNGVTNGVGHAFSSTSTSLSSGSDLGSDARDPEEVTAVRPKATELGEPPDWFPTALGVIAMSTGVTLPPGEAWLRYSGHRADKAKAISQPDARYWLTTVMVPEAKEVLRRAARDRERDATFDRNRKFAKDGPEKPPPPTKAQATAFAEDLAARVRAARTAGAR